MNALTTPADAEVTIVCAHPRCGATTTLAESLYIDGCGRVCPGCAGPRPDWWDDDLEPPY